MKLTPKNRLDASLNLPLSPAPRGTGSKATSGNQSGVSVDLHYDLRREEEEGGKVGMVGIGKKRKTSAETMSFLRRDSRGMMGHKPGSIETNTLSTTVQTMHLNGTEVVHHKSVDNQQVTFFWIYVSISWSGEGVVEMMR